MSAPEKEPETGTRDKPRQAPVPRISTREIRIKESCCCCLPRFILDRGPQSHSPLASLAFPAAGNVLHIALLLLLLLLWPRSSLGYAPHTVLLLLLPSDTSDKVPPAQAVSVLTAGAGPGCGSSLPLPSCPRYYPRVRVFVPAH